MMPTYPNLGSLASKENHPTSKQYSEAIHDSLYGEHLTLNNNMSFEHISKEDQSMNPTSISQKRRGFENFLNSIFKDSEQLNAHLERIKASLSAKIEQVLSPAVLLELFDRISQKNFSNILQTNKNKWNDDEVLLLTHILIYYSFSISVELEYMPEEAWISLASIFPTKDANQIKKRWQGCLKKPLWQVPWAQKEDEFLEQIMSEKGHTRKWKEIAEELNARCDSEVYRHGRQCRERWNNHLDPNISRNQFTEEEDAKLFQILKETGKKWADISKRMKNRTENAVKNRFNSLMRKLKSRQPSLLSENLSLVSTESELDSTVLERKLIDQFLQDFETTGSIKFLNQKKTKPKNRKSDPQDYSESIFESDSDSFSQHPSCSKTYSNVDTQESILRDQNRRVVRSLGEIADNNLKSFAASSIMMEEELTRNRDSMLIQNAFNSGRPSLEPVKNSETFGYHQSFSQYQGPQKIAQNNSFNGQVPTQSENPSWQPSNYTSYTPHSNIGNDFTGYYSKGQQFTNTYASNSDTFQTNYQNSSSQNHQLMSGPETYQNITSNPTFSDLNRSYPQNYYPNQAIHRLRNSAPNYYLREDTGLIPSMPQSRFSYDNFDNRVPFQNFDTPRFDQEINKISPLSMGVAPDCHFKTKSFDRHYTEKQITQSNLQYAIVDLSTNDIYMIHPVTKENFNDTLTKMESEQSRQTSYLDNSSARLADSELLMVGKSCEQSPSLSYLQSIANRPSYSTANSTFVNTNHLNYTDHSFGSGNNSNIGQQVNQIESRAQGYPANFQPINYTGNFPRNTLNNHPSSY